MKVLLNKEPYNSFSEQPHKKGSIELEGVPNMYFTGLLLIIFFCIIAYMLPKK